MKNRWREGLWWLLALAVVRIGIMLAMGWLTGGRHFTDDWKRQLGFLDDPFQILMARKGHGYAHYPPLQPIVTWLMATPFTGWLSSFYTIRCFSILGELMAWPLIWALFLQAVPRPRTRRILALTCVIMPVGWLTTSLFAQEEPLSLICLAGVLLLAWKGRLDQAAFLSGIGVVTAKVYFLIPLLALVLSPSLQDRRAILRRAFLGLVPIALVYGFSGVRLLMAHEPSPLLEFTPAGVHSTSIWVLIRDWLGLSIETTKRISMVTGLFAGLLPLVVAKAKGVRCEKLTLVRVVTAMMLFVFMWFYHCDPEYYLIVAPFVLVALPLSGAIPAVVAGFALPYAINLFYAVDRARRVEVGAGKTVFVHLYDRFVPFDPALMHTLSVLALCAVSLWITVWLTLSIARAD